MSKNEKKFTVRIATNGKRTKEWTFDTEQGAIDFAEKIAYIGDAQIDKALISPAEIRKIRAELGMTQREFSDYVGVKNHATIHEWENGKFVPRPDMQRKLIEMMQ